MTQMKMMMEMHVSAMAVVVTFDQTHVAHRMFGDSWCGSRSTQEDIVGCQRVCSNKTHRSRSIVIPIPAKRRNGRGRRTVWQIGAPTGELTSTRFHNVSLPNVAGLRSVARQVARYGPHSASFCETGVE